MKVIARIRNPYDSKFGVPRQSGLADQVVSTVVFEPEYRVQEALRGIEEFSHLWLIWAFDRAEREEWSPTVRPPRLGGNRRVGVFATRSPYRPNAIGLSCVKLLGVEKTGDGMVLKVAGADLMNGTPIYDIKPYLPYADCVREARGGFTASVERKLLRVDFPRLCLQPVEVHPLMGGVLVDQDDAVLHFDDDIGFQRLPHDLVVRHRELINILNRVFDRRPRSRRLFFR